MKIHYTGPAIAGMLSLTLILFPAHSHASTDENVNRLRSRILSMSHGYHSDADWSQILESLDKLRQQAERTGSREDIIEIGLLQVTVYSDLLDNKKGAMSILSRLKDRYDGQAVSNIRKVYVKQAEIYSQWGNEVAIADLIREYKSSPHYDPVTYPYSGGQGPNVPLVVSRPHAKGSDSITVTAMEKYRKVARLAPGKRCPNFQGRDTKGVERGLRDYAGKLLLINFWSAGAQRSLADHEYLVGIYPEYHGLGLEVLGVCIDRNAAESISIAEQRGADWPQFAKSTAMSRAFSVFGEPSNFLIDGNGIIIGRNLQQSELTRAVRNALGLE